jgi:hypothetical protein
VPWSFDVDSDRDGRKVANPLSETRNRQDGVKCWPWDVRAPSICAIPGPRGPTTPRYTTPLQGTTAALPSGAILPKSSGRCLFSGGAGHTAGAELTFDRAFIGRPLLAGSGHRRAPGRCAVSGTSQVPSPRRLIWCDRSRSSPQRG